MGGENPATPLVQGDPPHLTPNRREFDAEYPAWPSLPQSTTSSQYSDNPWISRPKLQRSKSLVRGFEGPSYSRIAILVVLCLIAYPAFHILTLVAKDRSLSIVRLIVSLWCSGVGFVLGYFIVKIGAQHLEAASEYKPVVVL